jgi:hypothetical protein
VTCGAVVVEPVVAGDLALSDRAAEQPAAADAATNRAIASVGIGLLSKLNLYHAPPSHGTRSDDR